MATRRQVITALENATEDTIRRIAVNITAELIRTTPVDTGWARANWVPSLGVPFTGNAEVRDPSETEVAGAAREQTAGTAAVLGYNLTVNQVFISNNVPYIVRLNDGSSAQAPAMFVQAAINTVITREAAR